MVKIKEIYYPGGYKEIIIYDNVSNAKNNRKGGRKKGVKSDDVDIENIKRRVHRVKRDIKRLALINRLYRMMTLTFRENIKNVDEADELFKKYVYALKLRGFKDLKYIMVREFQERGAVHYHCLISDYVPHSLAYKVWLQVVGSGSVNFRRAGIKGIFYLIKYIEKNVEENIFTSESGYTKKAYTVSKNLKRLSEDMVKESYAFVCEEKKDKRGYGLMGVDFERVMDEISEASRKNRLAYIQEGEFDEGKYRYRCCLIIPDWDNQKE